MQNPLSILAISLSSILLAFLPLAVGIKFKSNIATIVICSGLAVTLFQGMQLLPTAL